MKKVILASTMLDPQTGRFRYPKEEVSVDEDTARALVENHGASYVEEQESRDDPEVEEATNGPEEISAGKPQRKNAGPFRKRKG